MTGNNRVSRRLAAQDAQKGRLGDEVFPAAALARTTRRHLLSARRPMTNASLSGKDVLVVDGEYIIATDLRQGLAERGATVIGSVPSVEKAIVLIPSGTHLDGAILDVTFKAR